MSNYANPYQPPQADIAPPPPEPANLIDASTGVRLANLLLDYFAFLALTFAVSFVLVMLVRASGGRFPKELSQVLGIVLWTGYYIFFEGAFGWTVGKLITGTRVVNRAGGKPRFGQIVGRSFARLVPFEAFSFLGAPGNGWHDKWSGTRVVRVRR
jgi:uncharacterized RDD family membrane protein YckC